MEEELLARPYQVDLYEKAVAGNTIIYLPTGSGKTYIAIMLIKNMSHDLRDDFNKGGKRTVFIVNTVPLVDQQSSCILKYTDLTCRGYSGDMNVDFWKKNDWINEFEKYQVLVMTAQIFVDILHHSFLSLSQVNLLIFDECHHAVGDHPMRQIMKEFMHFPKNQQPKILGLSATLLNSNIKTDKINESIEMLESTFQSKVITVDSMISVIGYARVQEKIELFNDSSCNIDNLLNIKINNRLDNIVNILQSKCLPSDACNHASSVVFQPKTKNRRLLTIIENIKEHINTMGLYAGSKVILLHIIQLLCMKKSSQNNDTSIVLDYLITQLTVLRKLMINEMDKKIYSNDYERITNNSNDKLLKLLNLLNDYWNKRDINKKFCCIIFVTRRFKTKVLYHILKDIKDTNDNFKFLEPDYIVGYSNNPYKNSPESMCIAKWNKETLIRFRQGITNCLIATDVADEGIDIPSCSLIIRYDPPLDFRSYVQSKGRARDSSCLFTMFISSNDRKLKDTYLNWIRTENLLRCYITASNDDNIDRIKYKTTCENKIEPYTFISSNGNRSSLTDVSAVSLINRYCSTLGTSKFINCTPTLVLHKVKRHEDDVAYVDDPENDEFLYWVSLKFPLISPLHETINGDVMPSLKYAKRSAAMKACIELHKIGELNDKLLPRNTDEIIQDITIHLSNWINETNTGKTTMIGTNNNVRPHELYQISSFYNSQPLPNKIVYMHVINVKPVYSIPSNNRQRVFYNYLNDNSGYAILSSKKLSTIPSFPIYMNVGQLNVNIFVNHSELTLTQSEFDKLKNFHWILFDDVIGVLKDYLIYDIDNLDNSYFVVPIDNNWKINWQLVDNYKKIETISANTYATMNHHYNSNLNSNSMEICTSSGGGGAAASSLAFSNIIEEDWQIVTPKYRSSQEVYIVTKVCHEMNPMSPFPTDMPNYYEYYKEKHKVIATDMKQPLLEVKPVTKNINFILPKGEPGITKKRKSETHEEHFIPELCNIIKFSSMYWLKAITIPSILHRINQLLIADELRCEIIRNTNLGVIDVEKWPSLEFTEQEKILSDLQQQDKPINENSTNDDDDDDDDNDNCSDTESLMNMDIDNFDYDNLDVNSTKDTTNKNPQLPINNDTNNLLLKNNNDIDILSLEINNFPWSKEQEPIDLDKNMETIQFIDIEYYHQFNNKITTTSNELYDNRSSSVVEKSCIYSTRTKNLSTMPLLKLINISDSNNIGPSPVDIMRALTTTLSGDAMNLERLETLGDSFLKFITSIHLYENYNSCEGHLTIYKDHIIGNRNLYYCGVKKQLPGKLKIEKFVSDGNFITPSFCVPEIIKNIIINDKVSTSVLYEIAYTSNEQINGKINDELLNNYIEPIKKWSKRDNCGKTGSDNFIGLQFVKDKCISDCVEALTGVYLKYMGLRGAAKLLNWFGVLPNNINIDNVLCKVPNVNYYSDDDPIRHMPWIDTIEKSIDYKFNNKIYLLQAFTHSSYTGHSITCDYQRLEFLGDAVIDFLITVYIYENCGNLSPGELTDLRSSLVNNITFACLSVKYRLHTALLQYSPIINESIEKFVNFQTERNFSIDDDLLWILYEEEECNIAEYVEVPKILADIFESMIGAIYLDTNKNIAKVWEILYGLMKNEIDVFSKNVPKQPVRMIFEMTSVHPKFMKAEVIPHDNRTMVPLRIQVGGKTHKFYGFGSTRSAAKRAAAKQALKYLRRNKIN
ncbi:endoribonuclease Dicer-like [Aphidius gifuensis]|uniref:endoribonuclease Dicer-like n=1 Tax=Aphidius gifuensis TaxID=684658 RepID=UPI001CDBFAF4|nr:endoribonuclease Dicer-like [Aphidius gifuensis]